MIWFATDAGYGALTFQVSPEGLEQGDQLHLIDGGYSGCYIITRVVLREGRQSHLELHPANEETARKHGGFGSFSYNAPELAKSPKLRVLFS